MQAGKDAVAAAKGAAVKIGASAKSGMEKTKAVIQEKVEKIQADNPSEKEAAEHRRDEKIHQAEAQKQGAIRYNAAAAAGGHDGDHHHPTTALPEHGTAESAGGYIEPGATESHPIDTATGTSGTAPPSAVHNPPVGSQHPEMPGTGGG